MVYLGSDVSLTVINDFVVGTTAYLVLGPLALHPLEHFLTGDAVTFHDTLDAYLKRGCNHDDTIDQPVDARLVHDGTLHPLNTALLEVAEDGWVDNVVNSLGI
jgi:hypothetical protein